MLRAPTCRRFACSMLFPFTSSSDQNFYEKWPKIPTEIINNLNNYIYDINGNLSKETHSVINTTTAGIVTGFILGGLSRAKDVPESYRRENQATLYQHKFEAYREMQYKIFINMLKGGSSFGMKLGMFSFLFSSISVLFYIYKRKFDVFSSTCSGAITGFIYKLNMGLRGAFTGAVFGSLLGTIYGFVTALILYVSGANMDELYEAGKMLSHMRQEKIKENTRKLMQKEQQEIKQMHEQKN